MSDTSITSMSAAQMSALVRGKKLSPVEIASAHIDRIETLNGTYNAFVTPTPDRAIEDARRAEAEIMRGEWRGPLHGVPYGAKDIFDTAGIRTANGAKECENNVPPRDSECIRRMTDAGAVLLGKTNTHQWAAASTTINRHFGATRNPWDPERSVGGSSGGAAASLAAAMCPVGLGSDTGGSIRTPAALCGVVGFKATHGRVSLRGIYPNTPSFDHAGPMTRSVTDAGLALQAIAGYDRLDAMSVDRPVPDFLERLEQGVRGARIIVSPDFTQNAEVDGEVAEAFARAIQVYEELGARIETLPFPDATRFNDLFWDISGPEFAEVHRALYERDPDSYEDDVRARIARSLPVTTDTYVRAVRARELLVREVEDFLGDADAMISPTVPFVAPTIERLDAVINGTVYDFRKQLHRPFLSSHDVTGCPALVLPMGLNSQGLPMSVQVVSGRWREADVLRVARAYEAATPQLRPLPAL